MSLLLPSPSVYVSWFPGPFFCLASSMQFFFLCRLFLWRIVPASVPRQLTCYVIFRSMATRDCKGFHSRAASTCSGPFLSLAPSMQSLSDQHTSTDTFSGMPLSIRPASDLFLRIHGRATISRTISQANASSTSLACQRVDALAQLQIAKEPERSRVTQCAHRARQDLSTVKYDCITDQLLAPRHARPHGVACLHGVTFAQTFDVFCTARSLSLIHI